MRDRKSDMIPPVEEQFRVRLRAVGFTEVEIASIINAKEAAEAACILEWLGGEEPRRTTRGRWIVAVLIVVMIVVGWLVWRERVPGGFVVVEQFMPAPALCGGRCGNVSWYYGPFRERAEAERWAEAKERTTGHVTGVVEVRKP